MSGYPAPQPTAADYAARCADPLPVRTLKLSRTTAPASNHDENCEERGEELRRIAARTRLLNFILENHRQRQLDAVRGLRSSGAE
ncbi:hypothetical protein Pla123a_20790 [Posidoniimonas polymericola]|uniref:Uncharacterized protein n=1 Tax=Posidoniimonas polymericola TaxID=2528002 RepID=A0A5C5YRF0_9BACT|nr:hypothetical protein [Posidoniimonas polymericola]TWT77418.1 hypothetical protein Pla123a_20790 [Posidoniimonas polymericola]